MAIFLSSLINRFLPLLSVPIVQIILGACIYFLPSKYAIMTWDTELFFVLFVAPLIFNAGMLLDKKTFWKLKIPILNMAVLLVIASIFVIGLFVHLIMPMLPLAIAFILVAALSPTDDVAIISVSHRVPIPHRLMNLISGESIINDATGIVGFQLALLSFMLGTFSLGYAVSKLFIVGIGGILAGLVFTGFKFIITKWMRKLGIENDTLHILIDILTPFGIYLFAEATGVSGILAVFVAGIVHSVKQKNFNPETANLNIASKSIWKVFTFTLEGIVYLMLGTQLPHILQILLDSNFTAWELVFYVIAITLAFTLFRMLWFIVTATKKTYREPKKALKRTKAALIFSLSGVRGAVTMASVLSIPVLLSDGTDFPQRDLIILLASGVILLSLLISNFILPLVVGKSDTASKKQSENEACIEILSNVIKDLEMQNACKNKIAVNMIIKEYRDRMNNLHNKLDISLINKKKERKLKIQLYQWELEHTRQLLEKNEVDPNIAASYINNLKKRIRIESGIRNYRIKEISKTIFFRAMIIKNLQGYLRGKLGKITRRVPGNRYKNMLHWRVDFLKLRVDNNQFIIQEIKQLQLEENSSEIKKILSDYESHLLLFQNMLNMSTSKRHIQRADIEEDLHAIASLGFQIERDNIQTMFESNRISHEKAKELRNNISLLEMEMK